MSFRKNLTRSFAGIAASAVIVSTLPVTAFAAPATEAPTTTTTPPVTTKAEVRDASHDTIDITGIHRESLPDAVTEAFKTDNRSINGTHIESAAALVKKDSPKDELAATSLDDAEGDVSPNIDEAELAVLSPVTETEEFITSGITWDAESDVEVEEASIRVREGGSWTDWNAMEVVPNDGDSPRVGTEPLVTMGADAIQVRVMTENGKAPANVEVSVIDPGTGTQDGQPAQQAPISPSVSPDDVESNAPLSETVENSSNLRPNVITRGQWGATESWASNSSKSSRLKAMYVHHTAGTNSYYSSAQAYQQIRGIYDYHTRSLKWGDIGYQFLVDKFGNIYEGRRGSINSLPVGAQAGGFNTDTIGVSMMGNYDVVQPSAASVEAVTKVLAWKADQYNLNPTGTTTLTSRASAGSSSRYKYGTNVRVPVILGHRTTNATACPGRYMDAKLGSVRNEVKKRVNGSSAAPAPTQLGTPKKRSYTLGKDMTNAVGSWTSVPGATHYQIMYRAVPHGSNQKVASKSWIAGKTTTGTSADLGASAGETAQFAVRAVNGSTVGKQVYLGQHTGALNSGQVTPTNGATRGSSSSGVHGSVYYMTPKGSKITMKGGGNASHLVIGTTSVAKNSKVKVTRSGKYVGTMTFNGASLCRMPLGLSGDTVAVETLNGSPLALTTVGYMQAGQTHIPAKRNGSGRCDTNFTDNPAGSRYFEAVDWMKQHNMSKGYTDGSFRKDRHITRGESLALVHRYEGAPASSKNPGFRDVSRGGSFYDAISWGSAQGITGGYADGTFKQSRNVTRGEFASFLYRYDGSNYKAPSKPAFKDSGKSHKDSISWMKAKGLSVGYADGTYKPNRNITRAEVAVILHRYDNK